MANKFTTKEILNKVLLDSSGNAVTANSVTTQEALNAALDTTNNRLNMSLAGGTISGDVTISGDLTVEGSATNTYDEIIQGTLRLDAPGSVATSIEFVPTGGQSSEIQFFQDDGTTQDARIFAPEGATKLAFEAGTTEMMRMSSTGIGIGTDSPQKKVDIVQIYDTGGSSNEDLQLLIRGGNADLDPTGDSIGLGFGYGSADNYVKSGIVHEFTSSNGSGTLHFCTSSVSGTDIINKSDSKMSISSAGNVTMSGTLTVNGDLADISGAHPTLKLTDIAPDDNYGTIGYSDGALSIGTNGGDDAGAADTIIFYNHGSTERMRIASGGNVSIGNNSSPDTLLHVYKADASQTAHSDSLLTIENSGSTYMTILSGATSHGQIHFGDSGQNDDGVVGYDQATNKFYVLTNHSTTKKFQVDANGASTFQATADTTVATFKGFEGNNGTIEIHADEGDDNADQWRLTANTAGKLSIGNYSTGAWVNHITLDADSRFSMSNNGGEPTNTIFGYQAGNSIHGSSGMNTFFGHQVADATMTATADENTAVGHLALSSLTSGAKNIAIGSYAGINITTGDENVVIGRSAGNNHNSSDLVAVGTATLASINNANCDGAVAVGYQALTALQSGTGNTALGYQSADALTTSGYNTVVGYQALSSEVQGTHNVALGYQALFAQNKGSAVVTANIGIGVEAGYHNEEGVYNVFLGYKAGTGVSGNNNSNNVGIGFEALNAVTTGSSNTVIGKQAGDAITTGNFNTVIGANSDISAVGGTDQVVIGEGVTGTGNNEIALGNTSISAIKAQVSSITPYSSDKRTKKDIADYDLKGVDFIKELQLKTYLYKNPADFPDEIRDSKWDEDGVERLEDPTETQVGLIAQEVEEALAKHGIGNAETYAPTQESGIKTLTYGNLIFPLIKAVQELSARIEELENN